MKMKFPITRAMAATKLGRPYSTIVAWYGGPLVSEDTFKALKTRSDKSKRKSPSKKPRPPKKPKRYWHPASSEILTEEDIIAGATDLHTGDELHEIKASFYYRENTTWELESIDP